MGCNCGNKRNGPVGASGPPAARRTPPVVKRKIRPAAVAPQMPTRDAPRPFNRLRYYITFPNGEVESFNTLAEAQTVLRRTPGAKIESRRDSS